MSSFLLIEFAVVNRFHRAVAFPFIQGGKRARGTPCTWIRFGVPADVRYDVGETGVGLLPAEVETLTNIARDLAPTDIVFSHRPASSLVSALARDHANAAFVYIAESDPSVEPIVSSGSISVHPVNMGMEYQTGDQEPHTDPQEEIPDYSWIPGNDAASEMDVLPFVFTGQECTYNRSFAANPFFQDEELSTCIRSGGCSFCRRPPNSSYVPKDPIALLEIQLRRIRATSPTFGRRQRIRLVGEPIIHNIAKVADCIGSLAFPPTDFLLDSRADTLVRVAPELRRALKTIEASSHTLHLCLIGIENFCTEELVRFNKGIAAAGNLAAVRTLFELESEFPGRFFFREHGGLSLITFNPWTTPEQLDLNLAVVELLNLERVSGKLFSGRLRMYKGLPLELRARREGLVVQAYDDPLLDTASRNFYEDEIPWRFKDPLMEPINRLFIRIGTTEKGESPDPLAQAVNEAALEVQPRAGGYAEFAHMIVQEAITLASDGTIPSPEKILHAVRQSARTVPCAPKGEEWSRASTAASDTDESGHGILPLSRFLQIKPVSKMEPIRADEIQQWHNNPAYPNSRTRQRNWTEEQTEEVWELFYGLDAAQVERAVELTNLLEKRDIDDATRYQGIVEVGELLGYPTCCSKAFAQEPSQIQTSYFFALVARRVETPGEVPYAFNPVSDLVEYIPCSLSCRPSIERSRRFLEERHEDESSEYVRSQKNPWLLLHNVQRHLIELRPEHEPDYRSKYRAGRVTASSRILDSVAQGDEWVMEAETLLILKKGRPILSLSGRAYLWWYKRPFQEAFWKQIVAFRRSIPPMHTSDSVTERRTSPATLKPRMVSLVKILTWLKSQRADFAGLAIRSIDSLGQGRVKVSLIGAQEGVTLVIQEKSHDTRMLFGVGPYAISYLNESPVESDTQWNSTREFARKLHLTLQELASKSAKTTKNTGR